MQIFKKHLGDYGSQVTIESVTEKSNGMTCTNRLTELSLEKGADLSNFGSKVGNTKGNTEGNLANKVLSL